MLNLSDLPRLKGFRFPRSVIGYAVWAYHRFALSLRDVEDLLAARGITVSYETIRDWVARFGVQFAAKVRRDRPRPADKWHLDEVVVPIKGGRKHWLWRAVDAKGDVLDILVQSRRNKAAALRFFRKLFKVWGQPRVVVTDKLRSYGAAKSELASGDRASPAQGAEQSLRSVPPAHTKAGKGNGAIQVTWPSAAVLVGPRSNCRIVPPQAPPSFSPFLSPRPKRCLRSLD